ncbi:MAG TPA: hypothetical protein RMG48_02600 [Myxococcales bacterium LLY-WYZ-16_1]|nr:hypothetical protein [Myxococcales bacterium LLY-WYZ-16_1]
MEDASRLAAMQAVESLAQAIIERAGSTIDAGIEEALRSAMRAWTESRLRAVVQAAQGGD